jgi:hypothetical protein
MFSYYMNERTDAGDLGSVSLETVDFVRPFDATPGAFMCHLHIN